LNLKRNLSSNIFISIAPMTLLVLGLKALE